MSIDFLSNGFEGTNALPSQVFYPIFPPSIDAKTANSQMGFPILGHPVGSIHGDDDIEENDGVMCGNSSGRNEHSKLCARGHWRPAEDARLKELVAQFGPQNWNLIAEHLEGRSGKSCRLRWFNQLDPRINRRAFSEEEEDRLLTAHRLYGNKWAMIARLFPGRTDNAVKNHWHVIMARKHREQSTIYKRRKQNSSVISSTVSPPLFSTIQELPFTVSTPLSVTVDDSCSTCTQLSLTPSNKSPLKLFSRFTLPITVVDEEQGRKNGRLLDEVAEPLRQRDVQRTDQSVSGQSDSNSDMSATDSVATNRRNSVRIGNRNIILPFFDFLGVGATW